MKCKSAHLEVINIVLINMDLRDFAVCCVKYVSTHLDCSIPEASPKPITPGKEGEKLLKMSAVYSFSPT